MLLLEYLQQNIIVYYIGTFVFGLLVGSFLNVVIYRLPVMMQRSWRAECVEFLTSDSESKKADTRETRETFNLNTPRSRCQKCGHQITAIENIPLISYLVLGGKCRQCKTSISLRYPSIELLSALLVTFAAYHFGVTLQAASAMLLTWALIALTFIDYDHQYLPDNITLPFLWFGLFVNYFAVFTELEPAVLGAMLGYLLLWSIFHLFKLLTGKEGMGYGDFKLLAMLGAWLGWQMIPTIIIISTLVGSVVGITLIVVKKHQRSKPIPFGPYLAAAGWIALLWGNDINSAYLEWIIQ